MTGIPVVTSRQLIRALLRAGFFVHHVRGSHHYLKHPDKPGLLVSVPFHSRDLKRGTVGAILRQAGIAVDELRDLL